MFSYEHYLPFASFNASSIFFKATEVFRYGFLLDDFEIGGEVIQLYSYHNFYVEIVYGENFDDIKAIRGITVAVALEKYTDSDLFDQALIDLFAA
ncbi:MAG: hypothetical protein HKN67_10920 [Saprospiraceae bacterium]|nr:hypothetical protein [Bacteroidia bacterium]MBT8230442.1 hypothetical protein [Bacteroidia bacterium]NNF22447.1 hypothetical protein [Saprospiraceae bacterium]NNK90299.1 hypothetical protein [Saprospiraceae bacterium]